MTSQQKKKKTERPNLWLEHIAQNQQINGQQEVGIMTKIPLFDGSTSWFKFEELSADRLDLTVLGKGKRGPALRNRLVEDAEMHKGLDGESLRATNGIKYFRDTLRTHFIKRAQSVFLWRFHSASSHCS